MTTSIPLDATQYRLWLASIDQDARAALATGLALLAHASEGGRWWSDALNRRSLALLRLKQQMDAVESPTAFRALHRQYAEAADKLFKSFALVTVVHRDHGLNAPQWLALLRVIEQQSMALNGAHAVAVARLGIDGGLLGEAFPAQAQQA